MTQMNMFWLALFVLGPIVLGMGLAARSRYQEDKDKYLWWLD
jgi:uncharacterized membrane protein YesL